MNQPALDLPGDENRHALRKAVKMRAHLRDGDRTKFEIDVVDMSLSGFRGETNFALRPGAVVWLTLPGLAGMEAVVTWRDKLRCGCAFAKPIHAPIFDHIVALSQR